MTTADEVLDVARRARTAAASLAPMTRAAKDKALLAMADALVRETPRIIAANREDLDRGRESGLSDAIRAQKSGCLDNCESGCSVVVYPDTVWYGHVTKADVEEIVERHLKGGEPVERLQLFRKP